METVRISYILYFIQVFCRFDCSCSSHDASILDAAKIPKSGLILRNAAVLGPNSTGNNPRSKPTREEILRFYCIR